MNIQINIDPIDLMALAAILSLIGVGILTTIYVNKFIGSLVLGIATLFLAATGAASAVRYQWDTIGIIVMLTAAFGLMVFSHIIAALSGAEFQKIAPQAEKTKNEQLVDAAD